MRRVLELPLLVNLIGISAITMLVPAMHAYALRDLEEARVFLYGAILFSGMFVMLALATATTRPRRVARSHLISLLGAYVVLPVLLAVPFKEIVRDTSFFNAWFEMLSCLTTTGMTLYDDPERLSMTVHLWRGLVGWLGGFFIWVVAVSLLAPMNLGGFEVLSEDAAGKGTLRAGAPGFRPRETGARMMKTAISLWPVYAGLTAVLWLLLILAGAEATEGLILAMGTLSTSGIAPVGGMQGVGAGIWGEVAIAAFLIFALSRMTFTNVTHPGLLRRLEYDHEPRLGLVIVVTVPVLLFLRHWLGAAETGGDVDPWLALKAAWGAVFTVPSFLSTTGYVSIDWVEARDWSGLETSGVLLMGLAVVGGGVATTAGGVKLLRVWALYLHSRRELERLVHPSSIGGAGQTARRLRRQGAEIAWIFFMLFAMSLALISAALSLTGIEFEDAMVLSIASLSTTGPVVHVGADAPILLTKLTMDAKMVLMAAMVLGRLETLAIIALLNPEFWRN